MAKLSIILPSRGEKFLGRTVQDLLEKATGDIEVIAVLDGYWPETPLPADPRVKVLHKGTAGGMRAGINDGVAMASADVLMKLDAHCMVAPGFDEQVQRDLPDDHSILVPRRKRLDADAWAIQDVGKLDVDYHYLSYPFARPNDPKCGLHGTIWNERIKARLGNPAYEVDDEMSSQGSCWVMDRRHFDWLGGLDDNPATYGTFIQEFQELGLKTWLGGGHVAVTKRTWYAHLHKGPQHGRGYFIDKRELKLGSAWCVRHWMLDQWAGRVHDLRWLIEKFSAQSGSVPSWPTDLDEAFRAARGYLGDTPAAAMSAAKPTGGAASEPTGLTILSARYGVSEAETVDVADVVRAAVKDGARLDLTVTNEALGVGPVYPGQRKRLWVTYHDGKPGVAVTLERKSLRLGYL
jgi:glycosyltransferase involved in cell wall biosynthesis